MSNRKYRSAYASGIREYFDAALKRRDNKQVVMEWPSFTGYAKTVGVSLRTIENWRKANPVFDEACHDCEESVKETIISDSLGFRANGNFARFLLSSRFGMREKIEVKAEEPITDKAIAIAEKLIRRREKHGTAED